MNTSKSRLVSGAFLAFFVVCGPAAGNAATGAWRVTEEGIDAVVQRAMTVFDVPGMAVSVVHDGEVVYSKGHGVRELGSAEKVDSHTLFQIASLSKAFTAASLALLVDEGMLNWDDRVIDYLPEFRMYDPWVTREFTIRDLLTHRSGLPLGAGDLLIFPSGNTSIDIAGEVVARVSGMPYADFVESRLLAPLSMSDCVAGSSHAEGKENRAIPYVEVEGELQATSLSEPGPNAAAGGIQCSAAGMTHWLRLWLSHGQLPQGHDSGDQALISSEQIDQLLGPVTIWPTRDFMKENAGSFISAYALGWGVTSFYGRPMYQHGGLLWGMTSYVAMLPEDNLAVFASNNQMTAAPRAVVLEILDRFLGDEKDWIEIYDEEVTSKRQKDNQSVAEAAAARNADSHPNLLLEAYTGTYRDSWYGDIFIELVDGVLFFRSARTTQLAGPLEHFQFDTFIVRWTDRQLMADAYLSFGMTPEGSIDRITMKAVSPATDFSFDFHDLDLRRVTE